MDIRSGYLHAYLSPDGLGYAVNNIACLLRGVQFDSIAFRGVSGALLAPPVAFVMNKSLIVVRKPDERAHCELKVEGNRHCRAYVIVDDFISSGATVKTIIEEMNAFAPMAKFMGTAQSHASELDLRTFAAPVAPMQLPESWPVGGKEPDMIVFDDAAGKFNGKGVWWDVVTR